ncbi:hypothetical protein H6G06_16805 [Anabaena sphaerica FACHB-251]|uniref:Uncharacterized protein n=2 Tax=Anabaena TaxID=1163 RepID=A0A926WJQ3_9NOST|nr:hypothetical protein [Anabaena sphaerica FACHB-251]
MTQAQGFREALADIQATAQQELDQYIHRQADDIAPFAVTYSFDYQQFTDPALQNKAKTTLVNFLGFVRQTFDGILASGKALQEIYNDCLAVCPHGKQVFNTWLSSADFGASRYIASSAMKIYTWFEGLPERIQRLVKEKVQNWSVAALRQLTKVAHHLVEELVGSGKKTAAQIKSTSGKTATSTKATNSNSIPSNHEQTDIPKFALGVRVVVVDGEWEGYKGIITAKWELNGNESWWVLLDHTVSQGSFTKTLFKPAQIQPEIIIAKRGSRNHLQETFTAQQVEEKIAEALAQREREKAEEELGRFVEIRDAALKAAAEELKAAAQHSQKIAQEKEKLIEKLIDTEKQLAAVQNIFIKNQQLEQRVAELEKSLEEANQSGWHNTFSKQAVKVVNSELEKTIAPLMSEVERLNAVVVSQEQELAQLQNVNDMQQAELQKFVNLVNDTDEINLSQAEMSEQFMKIKNWVQQDMKID